MDMKEFSVLAQNRHSEATPSKIQRALEEVWIEIQRDPSARRKVAELLGIDAEVVVQLPLPVRAESPHGNLFGAEVALLVVGWVGNEILLKALANVVRPKVEKLLNDLWERMLQERVDDKLGLGATGLPVNDAERNGS